MENLFDDFIASVEENNREFVRELNDVFEENDCKCEIKSAKNGYMVSYTSKKTKKVVANFVFRKSGIKIRIYPGHLAQFEDYLECLPEKTKKEIKKASVCKRLLNPEDCNPRCSMGYTFTLEGEEHKKCRYGAFMLSLNSESNPYIKEFLSKELSAISK